MNYIYFLHGETVQEKILDFFLFLLILEFTRAFALPCVIFKVLLEVLSSSDLSITYH